MAVASREMIRDAGLPPRSVAERLRGWGLLPVVLYVVVTIVGLAIVGTTDVSALWLVGGVILAGMFIVIFFGITASPASRSRRRDG